MKKIIAFCVILMGFFVGFSSAATFESSILKVNVYRYEQGVDLFRTEQYGSSLYLGDGKILTNAHVILDEDKNEPFNTIEICGSSTSGSKLKCGYTAKVISYDPDIDLALLKLDQKIILSGIKLADKDPQTGDPILIKGFPRDGFSTLTQTEGTVGGIYNDYYKIDASINGGNSGGGGFSKKFALLGIPTFKAADGANIGYIIPVSAVKKFLKGEGNILKYTNKQNTGFSAYLRSINSLKEQKTIGEKMFSFTVPLGFKVDNVNISNDLFSYDIINTKSNVNVTISNTQVWGTYDINKYIADLYEALKNSADKITTGTIHHNTILWNTIKIENKGKITMGYYTTVGNTIFQIAIAGDSKSQDLAKVLNWYKDIQFKQLGLKKLPTTIIWNTVALGSNPLINFTKTIDTDATSWSSVKDVILDIDVAGAKKNSSAEQEIYGKPAYLMKLEEADLMDKSPEEILGIDNSNTTSDTIKGLIKNSLGSTFYFNKYKNYDGDTIINLLGFTTIESKKYAFSLDFNVGTNAKLTDQVVSYIDQNIKVLGDASFIERSDDPIALTDLFGGKKTTSQKVIDPIKTTFYDYTDYTTKALSRDNKLKLDEANKQGKAYIKLIDVQPTYTPKSDYIIKWYGEKLKNISIVIWNEAGVVYLENVALNKDNPSGLYHISLPKYTDGDLLLSVQGYTETDQLVKDYSDILITKK